MPVRLDFLPESHAHRRGFERLKEFTVQWKKERETRYRPDSMSPSLLEGRRSSGGRVRGWMTGRSAVRSFPMLIGRGRSTGSAFLGL
jgi:hypothetical protein